MLKPKIKLEIISTYKNKNKTFGIGKINNTKVFYKKSKNKTLKKEIKGYKKAIKYYNCPLLLYKINGTLIYEYKKELITNTLHEYFYFNKKGNIKKVLEELTKPYLNIEITKENKLNNKKLFKNRTKILKKYLKHLLLPNEIKEIIKEIIKVLNKKKDLTSIISLGDPTDTNISSYGLFTDFELAGRNSIIGEISILTSSILTNGSYFYPKYNKDVYLIRKKILKKYQDYRPNLFFDISDKRKEFLINYLQYINTKEIIKKDLVYLKYYLCMRYLTPISLFNLEEIDLNIIYFYIYYIYHNINTLDDLIKLIKEGFV